MNRKELLWTAGAAILTALLMFWPSLESLGGAENGRFGQLYEAFFHTGDPEILLGDGADPLGSFWIVGFVQDLILGNGTAKTTLLYAPKGLDLGLHEGYAWIDTLLAMPLRALIGSPGFYNLHVLTTLVLGVMVCTLLFRQVVSFPYALLSAHLLVCNEFVYQEIAFGRPTQVNWICAALFAMCVLKLVQNPKRWGMALLGGVAFGGYCLTYWFGAAGLGFVMLLVLLYEHIRQREFLLGLRNAFLMLLGVLIVILPVAGRLIWPILQGEPNIAYAHLLENSVRDYQLLGMSFPIYSAEPVLSWSDAKRFVLGRHYPLWLLCTAVCTVVVLLWKKKWSGLLLILVALLIPIGAALTIQGVVVPGPYAVIEWIFPPLVRCNFPDRLMLTPLLVVPLGLLLCVGPALDRLLQNFRGALIAAGGIVVLGNMFWVLNSHEPAVTSFQINRALIQVAREAPGGLIEFPFEQGNESYVQTEFHHQPVLTGPGMMMIHPAVHKRYMKRNQLFQALQDVNSLGFRPSQKIPDIDRLELLNDGFRHIVLYTDSLNRPAHHFERLLMAEGVAYPEYGIHVIPLEAP